MAQRAARGIWGDRTASVAVEFAFIAPVLIVLIFGVLEVGCMFFAQYVLKNAVIATARVVRTGCGTGTGTGCADGGGAGVALTSRDALANYICNTDNATIDKLAANVMLSGCTANLKIYAKSYPAGFSNFSSASFVSDLHTSAVKSDGTFNTTFDTNVNTACNIVLLRVSYAWNVIVPGMDWFLVTIPSTKQSVITATEVFRNEPASGSTSQCS